MRVYKYPLALTVRAQAIEMPDGAAVVHVHAQNDAPCLWVVVDPSAPRVARMFAVFATGEDVAERWDYVGTVHIGWTVWHVFEDVGGP